MLNSSEAEREIKTSEKLENKSSMDGHTVKREKKKSRTFF